MSSSRRLWTGDWEQDSARRAEELAARRRALAEQPDPESPVEEPVSAPVSRSPAAVAAALIAAVVRALIGALRLIGTGVIGLVGLVRRANARVAAVVALCVAVIVGLAFALSALFGGSGGPGAPVSSAAVAQAERWLGVQLAPIGHGGVSIETVKQNGAAAAAGLEPGDVLSQIDGRSIFSLADAARAIDRLSSGDQVLITVNRGSGILSTTFPMPPRPGGP